MLHPRKVRSVVFSVSFVTALLPVALCGAPRIVGIPTPPHDPNPLDAFEYATITASSPPTMGSYTSSNGDVFGGIATTYPGEQGNLLFVSNGISDVRYVDFQTANPIHLAGFSLYLKDSGTGERSAAGFSLYARSSPGTFGPADRVSTKAIHPAYADPVASGGYGSHSIQVSDSLDDAVGYNKRYFRLEVTTPSGLPNGNNGTRIVELDASTRDYWINTAAGDWHTKANWQNGTIPNGVGAQAWLDAAPITAPRTVYADEPITLGDLVIGSSQSYGITGMASLTMDNAGAPSSIWLEHGNAKINLPLIVIGTANVSLEGGTILTIADPLTMVGGGALNVVGSGTLNIISTVNNEAPATLRAVQQTVTNAAMDLTSMMSVEVANAAVVNLNANQHLAGLSGTSGQVRLAAGHKLIRTGSVAMTGTSALDLADGRLIVDYASPALPPTEYIRSQVAGAYAGGTWAGAGIGSSVAATDPRLGIGVVDASTIASEPFSFAGETVDPTTTLVAVTLRGDANLDFIVNFDDLLALSQRYDMSGTWRNGDSDYDGDVDFGDLLALAQNYAQPLSVEETAQFTGNLRDDLPLAFTIVPEPLLGGLIVGSSLLIRRQR